MISVVIPLYNKAHVVLDTIQTVLNQVYKDFEVIIVDDGSTDDGLELIKRNFSDSRLRFVVQKNEGVSSARNKGARVASFDYVAFIDADDQWHPQYLKIMAEEIRKYPHVGMFTSGGLVQEKEHVSYRLARKYLGYRGKIDWFENPFVFSHTSSTIVKKSLFIQEGGFPLGMKCLEDFTLFSKLAIAADVVYIGLPISKYVGGIEGQITSASPDTRFQWLKYVCRYYNESFENWSTKDIQRKTFLRYFKYDLRHRFKYYINNTDWLSSEYIFHNLNDEVKKQLTQFELFLYKYHIRSIAIAWINFTKVIWRLHNYPIVGEIVNAKEIENNYLNW